MDFYLICFKAFGLLVTTITVVYGGSSIIGLIISRVKVKGHQLGLWIRNPSSGKILPTNGAVSIKFDN